MGRILVLQPNPDQPWLDVLERANQSSFYHLPLYHELHEERGEGKAQLFVYIDGSYLIAIPLLLRPIEGGTAPEQNGNRWYDATSVYGHAGPISSHSVLPASVICNFSAQLKATLEGLRIVSVFSRLDPHKSQLELLGGLGRCKHEGYTVSIDLRLSPDAQRAQYRDNHRRNIDKLRRLGVRSFRDHDRVYLNQFIAIYYETMYRVNANRYYFFDTTYFERLLTSSYVHLFVCFHDGKVICGGLFTLYDGVIEYHLGATADEAQGLAPLKLLIDDVRSWAHQQGAHTFHLGGGVGARDDSLYHFKAGFTHRRHSFHTWRWTVLPDVYARMCRPEPYVRGGDEQPDLDPGYFPAYRDPSRVRG